MKKQILLSITVTAMFVASQAFAGNAKMSRAQALALAERGGQQQAPATLIGTTGATKVVGTPAKKVTKPEADAAAAANAPGAAAAAIQEASKIPGANTAAPDETVLAYLRGK